MRPARILNGVDHEGLSALVNADSWRQTVGVCEDFPAEVQTVCFECRLSPHDPRTDLAFCLFPRTDTASLVQHIRATRPTDEAWQRFALFVDEWRTGKRWAGIPFICVAFDLESPESTVTAPCLSLCMDEHFFSRRLGIPSLPAIPPSASIALSADSYRALTFEELPGPALSRLAACLKDPVVEIQHVSVMLPRRSSPLKLDVRLPIEALGDFLRRLKWPARVGDLEKRIREMVPWSIQIQLNLVIHPELATPLELELFSGKTQGSTDQRFAMLSTLEALGLCAPRKAQTLRATWNHPVTHDGEGRAIARSWYLKVRFQETEPSDAKAYLGLMPRGALGSSSYDRAATARAD